MHCIRQATSETNQLAAKVTVGWLVQTTLAACTSLCVLIYRVLDSGFPGELQEQYQELRLRRTNLGDRLTAAVLTAVVAVVVVAVAVAVVVVDTVDTVVAGLWLLLLLLLLL
ncbi:unnamed protein product, partial [Polarella glacialis]